MGNLTLVASQSARAAAAKILMKMRRQMTNSVRLANPLTIENAWLLAESSDREYVFFSLHRLMDEAIELSQSDTAAANKMWARIGALMRESIHPDNIDLRTIERFAKTCPLTYTAACARIEARARTQQMLTSQMQEDVLQPHQVAA